MTRNAYQLRMLRTGAFLTLLVATVFLMLTLTRIGLAIEIKIIANSGFPVQVVRSYQGEAILQIVSGSEFDIRSSRPLFISEYFGFGWSWSPERDRSPFDPKFGRLPAVFMCGVPTWFVSLLSFYLVHRFYRSIYQNDASRRSHCPNCGYDLRAHRPGQKCPECGHEIPDSQTGGPKCTTS